MVATDGYVGEEGAGWAFVVSGVGREESRSGRLPGGPSHLVEWRAASEALAWAEAELLAGDVLELRTDSQLVAKGLAGRRPLMSGVAAELRAACRQSLARLAAAGVRVRVERVPREQNAAADALAREAALG